MKPSGPFPRKAADYGKEHIQAHNPYCQFSQSAVFIEHLLCQECAGSLKIQLSEQKHPTPPSGW